jgi:hypothetical protein
MLARGRGDWALQPAIAIKQAQDGVRPIGNDPDPARLRDWRRN